MTLAPHSRKLLASLFPLAAAAARTDDELDDLLDAWLADDMASCGITAYPDFDLKEGFSNA